MHVGSLVFSTDQGLGVLARSFYDAGVVTDVMVVAHGRRPEHPEWYSGAHRINDLNSAEELTKMRSFVRSMDVMLFFETPFRWDLFADCKRSVLMVMHECMPITLPAQPDLILCPSLLDYRVYCEDKQAFERGVVHLPVPVRVPWRQRTKAKVFVHNAGNGGLSGRNGTAQLMEAMQYVKSPIKLILRSQEGTMTVDDPRISRQLGTQPYDQLWKDGGEGDVFVFPEKFNGLSLPLQEAHAAGMLVMASNRFPMNTWLPDQPLIPVSGYVKSRTSPRCREFDEAVIHPQDIAATIDAWYGRDISDLSIVGRQYAMTNSWEVLRPKYMEALSR